MNLESKYPNVFLCAITLLVGVSCAPDQPTNLAAHNIIPHPVEISATSKSFWISSETSLSFSDLRLKPLAQYMTQSLGGMRISEERQSTGILLMLDSSDSSLNPAGYTMNISEALITISAASENGIFNGIQTLMQLVPKSLKQSVAIPTGYIRDYPRYAYRGSMLDVSRHFFEVAEVKRYIDFLAAYKMNVMHLHLSDDQGWRIEIKAKPALTSIGSTAEVGTGDGGYYTQEDYKEIVQYAADRFITIIPEIDMPGHTQAALASYPVLNCDGKTHELYRGTEVGFSSLCTDNEATYEFVDTVIQELAAITPGPYIHIGGDESHVTAKEDYIYFVNRVQKIVAKHGKIMVGWDEIAQGDIGPETVVQQWNSAGNAQKAAENGNRVILSPAKRTYLDMKYDSSTRIGLAWASLIPVDHGYNWNPDTINKEMPVEAILGIEAPLWTETVENMADIEYLVFPRLPGYAEIGWSPQSVRSWPNYRQRLAQHGIRFDMDQINFYRSPMVDWTELPEGKNKPEN